MTTDHLARVRDLCLALPGATERMSHGEPTFFVRGKVFVSIVFGSAPRVRANKTAHR